jgi:aryl-alcohol dehydrogenase-like predicted oxidoreductase
MHYRQLGRSGLTVSAVGLGGNNFGRVCDLDATRAVVDTALSSGVTLIDTADRYGNGASEELLGEVLLGRRDEVVLATKFGLDLQDGNLDAKGSRRYVSQAVEASLRRLQTDYIDLYQYHQPDGITPMEETLAALDDLVREGKVRYIGSSNLQAWQIADAEWTARTSGRTRFISAQNHYNLIDRGIEEEVLPACESYGVGILPYFPLAKGLLTGKYHSGRPAPVGSRLEKRSEELTEARFAVVERLEKLAAELGRSVLELAICGLLAQPVVSSVIAGATTPEQVRMNAACGDWVMSPEERKALVGALAD